MGGGWKQRGVFDVRGRFGGELAQGGWRGRGGVWNVCRRLVVQLGAVDAGVVAQVGERSGSLAETHVVREQPTFELCFNT